MIRQSIVIAGLIAVSVASAGLHPQDNPAPAVTGGHTGTAEQALVGIEVVNTSSDGAARQMRRGNGFVLRCDGFILAPTDLFSKSISVAGQSETAATQAVTIVLNPGTSREERFTGRRPRFTPRGVAYGVVKLADFHAPALKTLLPDRLKAGDSVTVIRSAWDMKTGHFAGPQRVAAHLAPSIADEGGDKSEAPSKFSELLENVPAGAVVTGPDGMAVGLVTGTGSTSQELTFTSMAPLNRATNCVTPASIPDSDAGPPADVGGAKFSTMVPVNGGRMLVTVAIGGEQPDLEGMPIACIAPFFIDQFEVTNEEYLAFWRTLPENDRRRLGFRSNYYPWTWAPWPSEPPFSTEIARLPALGVPLPGAAAYAKWRGKRLPTPYEWSMAALGPRGDSIMPDWARSYIGERTSAWKKIKGLHMQYMQEHSEVQQNNQHLVSAYKLPWITRPAILQGVSAWSKQTTETLLDEVRAMWKDPQYVLPVGSREYDVSPCGAMDMILNASELVMPNPAPPAMGNARYMEISWTPPKPMINDPWAPRPIDVLTDGRPLQPLSRLYRRSIIGPSSQAVLMWSNINETVQMLGPLAGWQLNMVGDVKASATMWPRGIDPYEQFSRPAGLQLWMGTPPHFRREMGHPIPLDNPERTGPGPQLFYYLPVGFRCAK